MARSTSLLLAGLLPVAVHGCSVSLAVPEQAHVSCETTADCPSGRTCHPVLKQCVRAEDLPPEVEVAFISPRDGEERVSVRPTIVLAFNMDVASGSAAEHAHLRVGDGPDLPLVEVQSADGLANVVALTMNDDLAQLVTHAFLLDPGVEPAAGAFGTTSTAPFTSTFTTGEAPDRTPPGPVTDIQIDHVTDTLAELTWTNPSLADPKNQDFAGVLILRRRGGPVDGQGPEDGSNYAIGTTFGADTEVIAVTNNPLWHDVTITAGQYGYAFYAFDSASNYSRPPARVPFVSDLDLVWCPSESGTFSVASPDQGWQSLLFTPDDAGPAFVYPAPETEVLGAPSALAADHGVVLGHGYSVRSRAQNSDGVYLGIARPFVASLKSLAPLEQPVPVGIGGTASLGFTPYGWPAFQAEVDADPGPGTELWPGTTAAVLDGTASALMATGGHYRIRVRPVVTDASCADADWAVSDEFEVGSGVLYVAVDGPGPDGLDPAHALPSIGQAMTLATSGTDIFVSAGTYPESVTLKVGVRLFGGYSLDFRARDAALLSTPKLDTQARLYETVIAPGGLTPEADRRPLTVSGGLPATTAVDGFTLIPDASEHCTSGATCDSQGVTVAAGASPTISNNHVLGGRVGDAGHITRAIFVGDNGSPLISGNLIEAQGAATAADAARAIELRACGPSVCNLQLTRNHIIGHYGILQNDWGSWVVENGVNVPTQRVLIKDNLIEGDPKTPFAATQELLTCPGGRSQVTLVGNRLYGRANNTDFSNQNVTAIDLGGCRLRMEANRLFGGDGNLVHAIYIPPASSEPIEVVNNLIVGGVGHDVQAIYLWLVSDPNVRFANNVIYGGHSTSTHGPVVFFTGNINPSGYAAGTFANNIFITDPGWTVFAENLWWVQAIQNNVFLAPAPTTYYNSAYASAKNTVADMETYLCGRSLRGSGNIASSLTPDQVFVSASGADGKLETLDDNDWHLATTDPTLTQGGLDAASDICGMGAGNLCAGDGTSSCGSVTVDADGRSRTAPYSVGAYEVD